jgi:hypothetical protein
MVLCFSNRGDRIPDDKPLLLNIIIRYFFAQYFEIKNIATLTVSINFIYKSRKYISILIENNITVKKSLL